MRSEMILYHATSARNWAEIQECGLLPGAYLAEEHVAEYYAETVRDEGDDSVILAVDVSGIPDESAAPDRAGLEEPLTYTLGMSEEEVWEMWEERDGSWRACLDIIGSMRVMCAVPPELITEHCAQSAPRLD